MRGRALEMAGFLIFLTGATMDFGIMPDWVGHLCTPRAPKLARVAGNGRPYAIDNGCFANSRPFCLDRYLRFVGALVDAAGRPPLFAAAPDVVGDHVATWRLSEAVLPMLRALGVPAALVCQDGLTADRLPWDQVDAVFIGGSTRWKLGHEVVKICQEARSRGVLVHVGRVNYAGRIRHCHELLHANSVDGNAAAFDPRKIWDQIRWVEGLKYERVPLWAGDAGAATWS